MFQHGPLLGKEQRTRWALEDTDTLGQQVLVEVRGQEGLVGEDRVAHGTLIDELGLLGKEAGVLGVEMGMGTGSRLEGHGADGALVENLAVRRLDVRLDGVHTPKHHCTAGAPVSYTAGEMQTGLTEVGLKIGLQEVAPTFRTDMRGSVLVHTLVGAEAATIGQHHRTAGAHLSRG